MSIEDLARAAAGDARQRAGESVDAATGLDRLHHTRRTRNVAALVGAVVVAVVVVGGGALVSHGQTTEPIAPPKTSASPEVTTRLCDDPAVTCLGGYRPFTAVTAFHGRFSAAL